jgi:hypothetical protein
VYLLTTWPLTLRFSSLFLPLQFHVFFVLHISVFLQLLVMYGVLFDFQLPFLVTGVLKKKKMEVWFK